MCVALFLVDTRVCFLIKTLNDSASFLDIAEPLVTSTRCDSQGRGSSHGPESASGSCRRELPPAMGGSPNQEEIGPKGEIDK